MKRFERKCQQLAGIYHADCGLSIRMPGEVESYAETSDDGRDVLLIAESGQDWVYASVLYYPDSSDPAGTVEEIQAYRQEVLDSFLTDMGEEVSSDSGMMGDIAFDEAVTYRGDFKRNTSFY